MALVDIPLDLVDQARRGKREAVEQLLHSISPDLYRIVFNMVRDADATDEIVQEALVRIFRHLCKLNDLDRFAAWTMRLTVNQVQTWRVKNRRYRLYAVEEGWEPSEEQVVMVGRIDNPRRRSEHAQIREQVEQAMRTLPDRQQTAVVLYELEGCSIREIAQTMECSEGAVKFNLHEARKKLRGKLSHLAKAMGLRRRDAESG